MSHSAMARPSRVTRVIRSSCPVPMSRPELMALTAAARPPRYSWAVRAPCWVWLPRRCSSRQTAASLAKVEELLDKYGSDKDHILSATIYLKDMADFAAMNEIWDAWINDGHEPARACVKAELASPAILVEISVIAAVK